jgi:hypothetical protein
MPASFTNLPFNNTHYRMQASRHNVIPIASSIAPITIAGVKSSIKGTSPSAPGKETPPSWWAPPSTPAPFFHPWNIMPLGIDLHNNLCHIHACERQLCKLWEVCLACLIEKCHYDGSMTSNIAQGLHAGDWCCIRDIYAAPTVTETLVMVADMQTMDCIYATHITNEFLHDQSTLISRARKLVPSSKTADKAASAFSNSMYA